MELRHLRYFVAVAEAGSFVKAARALNVAQPALSRQVQALERALGVTLLERLPHGIRLTRAGRGFLTDSRRMLRTARAAATRVRDASGVAPMRLRVGYAELFNLWQDFTDIIYRFRTKHPGVALDVQYMTGPQIRSSLREDRIDLGLVAVGKWPVRGLEGIRLIESVQTGALLPAGHPLTANDHVRLADLAQLTWYHVAPDATLGVFDYARRVLRARGFHPRHRASRPGSFAFLPKIAAGEGWSPASDDFGAAITSLTKGIVFRRFADAPAPVWIAALWKKGQRARPVVDFLDAARAICKPKWTR